MQSTKEQANEYVYLKFPLGKVSEFVEMNVVCDAKNLIKNEDTRWFFKKGGLFGIIN